MLIQLAAVGDAALRRSRTCTSPVDGHEILKGVDLDGRRGRGPRPHGPERLGQVHPGQHPARQPRVRGHRRAASCFKGDDITDLAHRRAGQGRHLPRLPVPQEIPGVSVIHFLRQALSARKGIDLSVLELRLAIMEWMERLDMDPSFADRYLNEGFSGGEKKRNEILQMAILEPEIAILDETDSGLDIDALRVVAKGVQEVRARPARARRARSSRTTSASSTARARRGAHPHRRPHRRQPAGPSWPSASSARATRRGR